MTTATKAQFSIFSSQRHAAELDVTTGEATLVDTNWLTQLDTPILVFERRHSLPLRVGNATAVQLPYGLTVVSGPAASGKSSLLRALGVTRFLAVEPPDSEEELEMRLFNSADAALMAAITHTVQSGELVAIDSLRGPLFEMSGAAGEKGIVMPFFTALTRVSNSLARARITMLATVNPMHDDADYMSRFLQKLSASTACYIGLEPTASGFAGTIADREVRKQQRFIVDQKVPPLTDAMDLGLVQGSPSTPSGRQIQKSIERTTF